MVGCEQGDEPRERRQGCQAHEAMVDAGQEQATHHDEAEDDRCGNVADPSIQGESPEGLPWHDGQALDRRLRQRTERGEDEQQDGYAGQQAETESDSTTRLDSGGRPCGGHCEGLGDADAEGEPEGDGEGAGALGLKRLNSPKLAGVVLGLALRNVVHRQPRRMLAHTHTIQ